MIKVP